MIFKFNRSQREKKNRVSELKVFSCDKALIISKITVKSHHANSLKSIDGDALARVQTARLCEIHHCLRWKTFTGQGHIIWMPQKAIKSLAGEKKSRSFFGLYIKLH